MAAVGIIGLGIMGSAYARHLIDAGLDVRGADPAPEARARLTEMGGAAHEAPGDWLTGCDLVILSLASPSALSTVAGQLAGLLTQGQVVMDTGTFALPDKEAARDVLAAKGIEMLDCTVSGTGAQAAVKDLVLMASGAETAKAVAMRYIPHFTRKVIDAGAFGGGSKLKYIANLVVTIHNTAAAEALNYSRRMGLDDDVVYELLSTGAGQSKMLDLRMPLMISGAYDPPTASMTMFERDLSIIGGDLKRLGVSAPLFEACVALYDQASKVIPPDTSDAAAVYEAYRVTDKH